MSALPLPNGRIQIVDENGAPLVGGQVFYYVPGGLTPKDTYENYGATILNDNPIILDELGSATVFGIGRYRQIVLRPDDTQVWDEETAVPDAVVATSTTSALVYVLDGGGSAITTGVRGDLDVPFDCTITAATLLADQVGSIVVDVWKDTYANYPPTNADSITASAPPTITADDQSNDTVLTGWTTTITAGDTLRFNVDSCATITRVTLSLTVTSAA